MANHRQQADSVWTGESRIALGRALVRVHPEPASAAELASATGRDASNTRKVADGLVEAGVLERVEPATPAKGGAGRPPGRAFIFAPGERDRFVERFGRLDSPGLTPGQQLVFVDARTLGNNLLACLVQPELLRGMVWSALCDGRRQELVLAFEGTHAVETSMDLMSALSAAKVKASRASVSKVDTPAELARWVKRARERTGGK